MRRLLAASAAVLFGSAVLLAAPATAASYTPLDGTGLQQTVLRAQMPKILGSWRQNLYFTMPNEAPVVCWNAKGEPITLPKAATSGGVGYEVDANRTGGVMIFQYKDQASADAALAALKGTVCPDNAKIGEDGPASAVPASQGSDFADASRDSLISSITSTQQGVVVTTETQTTQRGLAVIQTKVTVGASKAGSKWVGRGSKTNRTWHQRVLAAYDAFGTGGSR